MGITAEQLWLVWMPLTINFALSFVLILQRLLGKRTLEVQHRVKMHDPRLMTAVWQDRWNVTQWWTFWVRNLA